MTKQEKQMFRYFIVRNDMQNRFDFNKGFFELDWYDTKDMEPNYPQLTIEEQRTWKIDHAKYIELCHKIYYETQNTGALFFDIVPNYEISKEGE